MSRKIDELVAERVMGLPRPASMMTYRDAEKEEGGRASWFALRRPGWFANIDWGDIEREKMYDERVEWQPDKEYSEDIAAAWEVVEKMEDKGYRCDVSNVNPDGEPNWYAKFLKFTKGEFPTYWMERSDTAPLAICLAALRAVGVPESEIEEAINGG